MAVRVLCSGDIHIGRKPSRTRHSYRTADAWTRLVDLAIERDVDVVALSGDVVDQDSKSYEALGPLLTGLKRLQVADIPVVAVAGNHDWDVLPRLSAQHGFDHLTLLGHEGAWEQVTIQRRGADSLHVVGWSFPAEHHELSPFASGPNIQRGNMPVMGLVHTELGFSTSRYAPTTQAQFAGHDVDFWLIGHIHVPRYHEDARILNPGSPFALDPGEPGLHGAWVVSLEPGAVSRIEEITISPVEYATISIDATRIESEDDLQSAVAASVESKLTGARTPELSIRLRFQGATPAFHEIEQWGARLHQDWDYVGSGGTVVSIDSIALDVRLPVNLDELVFEKSPAGETARLIRALESPDLPHEYRHLVDQTLVHLQRVAADNNFAQLDRMEIGESDARALLQESGWKFLSSLISTREQSYP